MSSALEKLKALAAAKKQQESGNVGSSVQEQKVAADTAQVADATPAEVQEVPAPISSVDDPGQQETATSQAQETQSIQHEAVVETPVQVERQSDHPLIMELAELEQQLNDRVPDFRLTLRNIHQKLRKDPDIVTILSEEEIGLIVTGLATHANAEIVAPKAAKAAKAAAKKTPISADDL